MRLVKNKLMEQPFFTNAPCNVTFVGGNPETLRKVQAVELRIGGMIGWLTD